MSECIECNNTLVASSFSEIADGTCPAVAYQKVDVCVPVAVTPFAHAGKTKTKCCGDPRVLSGDIPCAGRKNGVCTFTVSQTLCVEVPVVFGASAHVGDTYVDCLGASTENICMHCQKEEYKL